MSADRPEVQGISIDPPGTHEVDDVIWAEENSHGFLLEVHIADVASHVELHSHLNNYALYRGCSRYREGRSYWMFPRDLTEQRMSLKSGEVRNAVTLTVQLTIDGIVTSSRVRRTACLNRVAFTYEQADAILAGEGDHPEYQHLNTLSRVSAVLRERRRLSGALILVDPLRGWEVSEAGVLRRVTHHFTSHDIVQECMLLTNTMLPTVMREWQQPFCYRNQQAKYQPMTRTLFVEELQRLLVEATSLERGIYEAQQMLAHVLGRAYYEGVCRGHYALNVPAFGHCTSPLRRYWDLLNQRRILAAFGLGDCAVTHDGVEMLSRYFNDVQLQERAEARRRDSDFVRCFQEEARHLAFVHADDVTASGETRTATSHALDRLQRGRASIIDVCFLLLGTHHNGTGEQIRHALDSVMATNPAFAARIFEVFRTLGYPAVNYEDDGVGHIGGAPRVRAHLPLNGTPLSSDWHTAPSRRIARQLAATDLLSRWGQQARHLPHAFVG